MLVRVASDLVHRPAADVLVLRRLIPEGRFTRDRAAEAGIHRHAGRDRMRQFASSYVHLLVVSELRSLLPILGVCLDVDGHQASKVSALTLLHKGPRQRRHVAVRAL